MTSRDFCYWLQGYFEISKLTQGSRTIQDDQVGVIQNHLAMVFKHEIDPSMGDKKQQAALDVLHGLPQQFPSGSGGTGTNLRCSPML